MNFFETIVAWVLVIISRFGYKGILLTMALESAAIPIPSEVVLPFSGFLASTGQLSFWFIVVIATIANLIGALVIYYIGTVGGRPFLDNYGKYFLVDAKEAQRLYHWLGKYQKATIFFSRLLPGVRTFSALVIGISDEVQVRTFILYTLLGSFLWNLALTYIGFLAGDHWNFLHPYFQKADFVIGILLAIGIIYFVYKHLNRKK